MRAAGWTEPTLRNRQGHVLAVMTCPRPAEQDYLKITLATLKFAGLERWLGPRMIVADGYEPLVVGWPVYPSAERLGNSKTFLRALTLAVDTPGFTALTLLEDDVCLARNALDYIAGIDVVADPAVNRDLTHVAWCSFQPPRLPQKARIYDVILTNDFVGNQAVTMSAERVRALLASPAVRRWNARHNADLLFTVAFPDQPCGIHRPNLAQHIGLASAVDDTRTIHPASLDFYIGDALDLLRKGAPV